MNKKLTLDQAAELACRFKLPLSRIRTIISIEAPRGGFLPDGRCVILFERHHFFKRSGSVPVSASRPDLSNKVPGGYKGGAEEWQRLLDAMEFHRQGAIESTSFGLGQIMGFNHEAAGFASAEAMMNAFAESEYNQALGMLNFIKASPTLYKALIDGNWPKVAELYNGKNYKINKYDEKLAAASNLFSNQRFV